MKKKAIKIAASTAVAASAFVAAAPAQQADAATNVNQLITDAQNAGTVLKWAISVEGTADYKTEPWAEYNNAKNALKKAEDAIAKLATSEKLAAQAKLVDPKVSITRAGAYIDAITSGKKILAKNAAFEAAVKAGNLDQIEKEYHVVTEEFRKQTILNYRVYGQSTRDEILKEYKLPIEKTVRGYANEVTVHMLTKAAAADVKANKLEEAALKLTEAQSILDAADLKWETTLQKSADDVAASMPLQVLSVSRTDKNTVVVKFSKTPADLLAAGQFTFDNGLVVQSATLGTDKKTVTLKTTDQVAGKTYALAYQGVATGKSFTAPANPTDGSTTVDAADTARIETTNTRTYTASVKNSDNGNYTGVVEIQLKKPDGTDYTGPAYISNIDGVKVDGGQYAEVEAGLDGKVSIIVSVPENEATTVLYPVFTNQEDSSKFVKGGLTYFYEAAKTSVDNASGTYGSDLDFIDKTNNYVVLAGLKYNFDSNDTFIVAEKVVTLDAFKAALSKNDTYTVDYQENKANTSVFTIIEDTDADADVEIKNPAKVLTYDGTTFRLTGEGQPGSKVYIYLEKDSVDISDLEDDSDITDVTLNGEDKDTVVAETTVGSNGTWAVQAANLKQNVTNKLYAVQVAKGDTQTDAVDDGTYTFAYLNVGKFTSETITWNDNSTPGLSVGDSLLFDFVNNEAFGHDFKNGTKGTIVVDDGFGRKATLTVEHTSTTAADTLVITKVSAAANFNFQTDSVTGASYFNVDSVSGVLNQDNVTYKLHEDGKSFTK
ncbi:hypothetical protein NSQ95_03495 [Psychrobacillus sp. FSL W7-1457]|uniref:hypothetical protein n=1 Tax=Psychrobacillus sp. FSL W7-1457 TaxID=2954547 RepID=UPI003159D493